MQQIELPEDVIRIAALSAKFNGEAPEEWLANLIRHHADTAPYPAGPRVIDSNHVARELEAAAAEEPDDEEEPEDEEEPADDPTLLVRTLQEEGLLEGPHVTAVDLREAMHRRHGWYDNTHGSRRISDALRQLGVQKLSTPVVVGDNKRTAYPTAKLRKLAGA